MTALEPQAGAVALRDLSTSDQADLHTAVRLLEQDSFTDQVMALVGKVVGPGVDLLTRWTPAPVRDSLSSVLNTALAKAFDGVLVSVDKGGGLTGVGWLDKGLASTWVDRAATAVAGAVGGGGGVATTVMELPVTTAFLMRAIAQIAVREGEDLHTDEAKLQCLQVFAMGGPAKADDPVDGGYYAMRVGLAEFLPRFVDRPLGEFLPKLIVKVAERFQVSAATKLSAQSIPALGAITGAAINLAFLNHFQDKARGHFTIRRLERRYGAVAVQSAYAAALEDWRAAKAARRSKGKAKAESSHG